MGTRGAIGFYKKGITKVTYNHYDSYPESLGVNILSELEGVSISDLNKCFKNLKLINDDKKPTKSEIKKYSEYADTSVGNEGMRNTTINHYYQLFRKIQGTLKPFILGKVNLMIDSKNFLKDSLFCEWAYIVNLDINNFEVWKGYQQTPQKGNRYGEESDDGYYPVKLIKTYSLNNLPEQEVFIKEINEITKQE